VEFGQIEGRYISLGPYKSRDLSRLLLRFPARELKWKEDSLLQVDYKEVSYSLSLEELADFYTRKAIYDAPAIFELMENGKRYGIANHSAVIAKPGEKSLNSLIRQLIPDSVSREARYQLLLDFVSEEIEYEYLDEYEIFFKPNEVLLRQKSDCSGKVVLYASLLEQMQLPYLLVYTEGHILVAVPGDFSIRNGIHFDHDGGRYYFAETTLKGFQIGKSMAFPTLGEKDIQYLQKGGKNTRLYDYQKGDSLDFMTMEVVVPAK